MTCPFTRSQGDFSDPDCIEINLTTPCRYIPTIPKRFLSHQPLLEYPGYLRNTVNHSEHMKKVRNSSISCKIGTFDEFKKEGNCFFHAEDFDRALECYEHAYGLLKFLEVKDEKNLHDQFDVVFHEGSSEENEIRNKALVLVLSSLAFTFIQLRHFDEACEAVKEALEIKPNDPDLISIQVRAKLSNIRYQNLSKVLKNIKKIVKINKKYEFLLEKFHQNTAAREEITGKIYKSIAASYVKNDWDLEFEISSEKELEHRIIEEMQEKYYEMIEFYMENNKSANLSKIREELQQLQMILFKMDFTFAVDDKDVKLLSEIKEAGGKADKIVIPMLDSVKRVHVSLCFNEGKFNQQLLSFCMEKCSESEKKKQKVQTKKTSGWTKYLVFFIIPVVVGGLVYRMCGGINFHEI